MHIFLFWCKTFTKKENLIKVILQEDNSSILLLHNKDYERECYVVVPLLYRVVEPLWQEQIISKILKIDF